MGTIYEMIWGLESKCKHEFQFVSHPCSLKITLCTVCGVLAFQQMRPVVEFSTYGSTLKVLDFGAFLVLSFQIRDAQPVS